jgi:hypothetical protein
MDIIYFNDSCKAMVDASCFNYSLESFFPMPTEVDPQKSTCFTLFNINARFLSAPFVSLEMTQDQSTWELGVA